MSLKIKLLIVFAVLLVGARIALPYVAKHYLNKTLQNDLKGYTGSVADVDIALIRGAYSLDKLTLKKKNGKVPVPFLDVDRIEFSVEWQALFDGSLVAEITAIHPKLNFVDGPSEAQTQTGEEGNWQATVDKLFPLRINKFVIRDGEVHFRNLHATPKVDVFMNDLDLVARNLTNSEDISKTLVATVDGNAKIMGDGRLTTHLDLNPLQKQIPFNLDLSLERVPLTKLNDFFRAYAKIDMEQGTFNLYSEIAGGNGKFNGYLKPIFKDAKVLDVKEDDEKPFRLIWEAGIGLVNTIFRNYPKDQVATKIPVSGDLNNPDVDVSTTVIKVLENAFVKAINPSLDETVNLGNMKDTEATLREEAKHTKKTVRKEQVEEKKEERKERRAEKREEKEARKERRQEKREEGKKEREEKLADKNQ